MALSEAEIRIVIAAKDEASKVLKTMSGALADVDKAAAQVSKSAGGMSGAFSGIGAVLGGAGKALAVAGVAGIAAGAAFDAVTGAVKGLIGPAAEAQAIGAQLDAVLRSTGGGAGVSRAAVEALSTELSRVTTFEDDAITSAQGLLLTFTKIGADVFPQATETVLNMSQALGQDLKSSALQLGKALNEPVEGVGALRRVGVQLTDAQEELVKALVATGDVAGAQAVILQELETEFGNSARAAGETFPGQLAILQNEMGNLAETAGGALLPVLTDLVREARPLVQQFGEWLPGAIASAQGALEEVRGRLDAAGEAVAAVRGAFDVFAPAVDAAAGAVQAAAPVVEALAARFEAFASDVAPLVASAFERIQQVVGTVLGAVGNLIQTNLAVFQAQWAEHGATITTIVSAVWGALSGVVEAGLTVIGGTIKTVLAVISGDWGLAWQTMITTATTALGQLAGAIGALAGPIGAKAMEIGTGIISGIVNGITGGIGRVTAAAQGLAQRAIDAAMGRLHEGSPSKVFEEIGENVAIGLAMGVEGEASAAVAAVEDMVAEMQDATVGFTLVDSILGSLDTKGQDTLANFLHDSERVIEDVGRKAEEVGRKTAEALATARDDAANAIQDVREGAASRALELVDNQGLSREIRAVRERFGEQQDEASRAYTQQREDAELTAKYERDLAKAKTGDEKAEVRARFKEATDDLVRRRQQDEADRAFKRQQNEALQAFNDRLEDEALQRQIARLQRERDERIEQITEALDEKTRKVIDQESRERATLAQSASDKLNDLKERFFDKVGPLTEETRSKFEELFKSIAQQVGNAAKAVNDLAAALSRAGSVKVGGLTNAASAGQSTWENQTQAVRDMFTATWGAENAKRIWQEEHAAELGVPVGTTTSSGGGGGGGSAPAQTSDVHAAGFDWGAYNAQHQGEARNPDGTVKRASGGPVLAGMPYTVGEHGAETFVPGADGYVMSHGAASLAQSAGGGGDWGGGMDYHALAEAVAAALRAAPPEITMDGEAVTRAVWRGLKSQALVGSDMGL